MNCSVPGWNFDCSVIGWLFGNLPRPLLLTSVTCLRTTDRLSVSVVGFSIVDKPKYEDDKDKRRECQTSLRFLNMNLTQRGPKPIIS
jgi:hypothetical protein